MRGGRGRSSGTLPANQSRPYDRQNLFATTKTTAMEDSINTYHCLCATLILATPFRLDALPTRAPPVQDQSAILPLGSGSDTSTPVSRLYNVVENRKPTMMRREDGFEKRGVLSCSRCQLAIGYKLEDEGAGANLVYILPGGLVTTEDMKTGTTTGAAPSWAAEKV